MKRLNMTRMGLALAGASLATTISAGSVQECYNSVCAAITADECVAEGSNFDLAVDGSLNGASGFSITSYQVVRNAKWSYNSNHQVVIDDGEVVDQKGFLFAGNFAKTYREQGGKASKYTFVYGSRNFGHGFYDVAVDVEIGAGGGGGTALAVDIKPGTCPNPVNAKLKGVLPVAVLGTAEFDVRDLDPASIKLAGVPALRYDFEDVSTPSLYPTGDFECGPIGGDGIEDMTVKFKTETVIAALEAQLGRPLYDGEIVPLQLTAELKEGGSACGSGASGADNITILSRGKGKN